MRHGRYLAVLVVLVAAGCSTSKPLKDMVGYVPPTNLPAQPKRTLVADRQEQVWARLVDTLGASTFSIEHIDEDERLLVIRYSGNPEPYIDCGSIVTHQNGALGQVTGAAPWIALYHEIEKQPVVLNRSLNLDSRITIRLSGQPQGTVIDTDTTYVVTKTVDVVDPSGVVKEGNRETVSFEAGGRGEFSKGTICQSNGSLDLAVLQRLPNIIGSDEIDRAELPGDGIETPNLVRKKSESLAEGTGLSTKQTTSITPNRANEQADALERELETFDAASTPAPGQDSSTYDWVLPDQGLPTAALPTPGPTTHGVGPATSEQKSAALAGSEPGSASSLTSPKKQAEILVEAPPIEGSSAETVVLLPDPQRSEETGTGEESPTTIVDETTRKLLKSLDCSGEEWHFCDLVELTTPYRKRNIERLFGLTVNTSESFAAQVIGSDLNLDILFPSFPSHLHIAYARRDGTIDHVMSSTEVWPADLAHQLTQTDRKIPGPSGLAMIIAVASEKPLFSSPPTNAEDAATYLDRLKQRLAELESDNPESPIAASQLLIYVENAKT